MKRTLSIRNGKKSFSRRAIQRSRLAVELLERRDLMAVYQSADVPKAIPDPGVAISELDIADTFSQPIVDVNVNFSITHTYDADLRMELESPTGTIVSLIRLNGSSGDNFTNTTLDDEATTSISFGSAPFTGSFRPLGTLSNFDGQSPTGKWKLRISDDYDFDSGTLLSWSIDVQTGPLVLDIVDIAPDPRNFAVQDVDVVFSEPVDFSSFDFNDITLTRNNTPVALNSSVTVQATASPEVFTISGIALFTDFLGSYAISVDGSGIKSSQGQVFAGTRRDTWEFRGSQAIDVVDVSPDPRNTAVDSVEVRFTLPINLSTFDFRDIQLRVDASRNIALDNTVTIEQIGTTSRYRISGLSPFTSELHSYEIQILGGGITDDRGFQVTGTPTDTWKTQGPQVLDVVDVTPDPRNSSIDTIDVKFQFPINLATFGMNDIELLRNGVLVPLGSSIAFAQGSDATTYRVSGLAQFTSLLGSYEFKVKGGGVLDTFGNRGSGIVSDTWQLTGPYALDVVNVMPDPRNSPVDTVDVKILHSPVLTTFDFNDVVLKRNSQAITLDSTVTIARVNQTDFYRISGLSAFTRLSGSYSLTVSGSTMKDSAGRTGTGVASDSWYFSGPYLTNLIGPPYFSRRNTPVDSVEVSFQFPIDIATFDFQDVRLIRNQVNVPLSNSVTVSAVNATGQYRIDGLAAFTGQEGLYQIIVSDSEIADQFGNVGTRSLGDYWTMDTTVPHILDIVNVTPDPRLDNSKSVGFIDIVFSENIIAATFDYTDISLRVDGGPNLITSAIPIYNVGNGVYRIYDLGPLTNASGHFELIVSGQFTDLAGNIGSGSVQDDWSANNSPKIRMGGALLFPEGSRPLCLTANATVSDDDTSTFSGGKLLVEILGTANANEQLGIIHRPNLVGYVGVSGNKVLYQGTEIGTFSGGQNSPLIIDLNSDATHSAVAALTNSITYQRTGQILQQQVRSVRFSLSDGEGGTGRGTRNVTLIPYNDPGSIQLDGPKNYVLNGLPLQLAPAATVTDLDTNLYTNGILRIGVSSGYDRTEVFGLTGSFSIANGLVLHNGTTIGATIVNNTRGRPLAIRFNQLATVALIQDLIRSVSFQTNASSSTASREIEFSLRDGQGVYSPIAKMQVNIVT